MCRTSKEECQRAGKADTEKEQWGKDTQAQKTIPQETNPKHEGEQTSNFNFR